MRFVIRLLVNAAAIWLCDWLFGGIALAPSSSTGQMILSLAVVALVFTLVNMLVKPVVKVLSLPFYIITLGLFFLVVNALMLLLTGWITSFTNFGLSVDGFGTAVVAGVVIAVVSWLLHLVIPGKR
ncbi:phage holin family protein [Georgenia alba]|uniref:Phage holin family protein n=1 Tax=Georgenia alba TaxID=2233858 RepID=A0ABW2Q245_9MICO